MPLSFKFDPNEEHQVSAIEAISGVFEGQMPYEGPPPFTLGLVNVVPNMLDIGDDTILGNVRRIQKSHGLKEDEALDQITETIDGADGPMEVSFQNFSVEMETGTGKTYVYLRTLHELRRRCGFLKFIIVVPSIAVKEGAIATVDALREHFSALYDNPPYEFMEYDSSKISIIRQFAASAELSILLMTVDSFNKAANIIRQRTDKLQGDVPLHLLQQCRPIIIMDEPQNMESDLSILSIASLNPLCTLRYSATHRNPYNLVYRLTPYEAYRLGLVKKVEVAGIEAEHGEQLPFIQVNDIKGNRRSVTAAVQINKANAHGAVDVVKVTLRQDDDLQNLSGLDIYEGYIVEEISANRKTVVFGNGKEVAIGEAFGSPTEPIMEAQIRYTIEEHFRKADRLKKKGIKILSLFFISAVADYTAEDGFVRKTFDRAFKEIAQRYPNWKDVRPEDTRAAYFATKRRKGVEIAEDTSGSTEQDRKAYNLIMKKKATLASLEEPVAFIFSHTALREGWDSPNVFQICTLNRTKSNMKKRQEVGRGVRLAVDSSGSRVRDEQVNVLTVVCNENYEKFVRDLQDETVKDFGLGNEGPRPENARKRRTAHLKKAALLTPEFLELWNRIRPKTRYTVEIDAGLLIQETCDAFKTTVLSTPAIKVNRFEIEVNKEDVYSGRMSVTNKKIGTFSGLERFPSVLDVMLDLLERTAPPIRVTRRTLYEIYKTSNRSAEAARNPQLFAEELVGVVRRKMIALIIDGIKYIPNGEYYDASQFEGEIQSWEGALVATNRSVYDNIVTGSEAERRFAAGLEANDQIKLFIKLPSWFKVGTPLGTYNPDWAVVKESRDEFGKPDGQILYLVRETKGNADEMSLRRAEYLKTLCGKAHFGDALKVDYAVVAAPDEV
ncbi:MAG: restriction endonuclease [Vulcanimicrobiaceae bacterium]